jgi:hypothetical protein
LIDIAQQHDPINLREKERFRHSFLACLGLFFLHNLVQILLTESLENVANFLIKLVIAHAQHVTTQFGLQSVDLGLATEFN